MKAKIRTTLKERGFINAPQRLEAKTDSFPFIKRLPVSI